MADLIRTRILNFRQNSVFRRIDPSRLNDVTAHLRQTLFAGGRPSDRAIQETPISLFIDAVQAAFERYPAWELSTIKQLSAVELLEMANARAAGTAPGPLPAKPKRRPLVQVND